MIITRSRSLDPVTEKAVWKFLDSFSYIPYQQFPSYPSIEGLKASSFIAREGEKVIGWVQVIEKKNMLAAIEFGPLAKDIAVAASLLQHVLQQYRRSLFTLFRWMPYWFGREVYDELIKQISASFNFQDDPGSLVHWSSKRITLMETEEGILKKFSENHRRNIKKGLTFSIECREITEQAMVAKFTEGYVNMYRHRKLSIDTGATANSFNRLHQYLTTSGKGFFMGAFREGVLLGGLIIIFQGDTAFYHKGYIDHEQRQIPINHVAFYQSILHSKNSGLAWFDFGGYDSETKDEQLVNINKFKDGFKGELVQFPPSRIIGLNMLSGIMNKVLSVKNRK